MVQTTIVIPVDAAGFRAALFAAKVILEETVNEDGSFIVKVSGLGILLIGLLGFIIHVIDQFIKGI